MGYAVQDLDAPALTKIPAANTASNLTGKIAGLKVSNSPNLFDTPALLLRGVAPVVVIDGVPVESATFWEVAPEDIESMCVLKGPAAAVLYGQMGQNGVIQITTKKAKEAVKISVNSSTGFDTGMIANPSYQKNMEQVIKVNIVWVIVPMNFGEHGGRNSMVGYFHNGIALMMPMATELLYLGFHAVRII